MPAIKINAIEQAAFMHARGLSGDAQKELRNSIWASVRQRFGIPAGIKLSVDLDNASAPSYLAVKEKGTARSLGEEGGRYVGFVVDAPASTATPIAATPIAAAPADNLVRYAAIKASEIVDSANDVRDDFDTVRRPDCGRIAYDEAEDLILVRIPQA